MSTSIRRRTLLQGVASLTLGPLLGLDAHAADTSFPTRSPKLVVPFAAGGGSDILGRLVAARMGEVLGQPIVVENRPGASTNLAAEYVAHSPADGYTMLLGNSNALVVNKLLFRSLPYDPAKDFTLLGMAGRFPFVLVTSPVTGIGSVAELVSRAKAKPGALTYASPGAGSPHHLSMELFKQRAGIYMTHVSYRGVAPALQDLLPGRVDVMLLDLAGAGALASDGKLKVLAAAGAKRIASMPQVPTIAESGYPGFDMSGWQGLAMPAGAPPEIVAKLRSALTTALADPASRERLQAAGLEPANQSAQDFDRFVAAERVKMRDLIVSRKLSLD